MMENVTKTVIHSENLQPTYQENTKFNFSEQKEWTHVKWIIYEWTVNEWT